MQRHLSFSRSIGDRCIASENLRSLKRCSPRHLSPVLIWASLVPLCQAAVTCAALLTGALLALTGQIYQTGADAFELFAAWAVTVVPWVIVARFAPLWLLWIALLNLSVALYFVTFRWGLLGITAGETGTMWTLFALSLALVLWEAGALRGIPWMSRWAARVLAVFAGCFATTIGVLSVLDTREVPGWAFLVFAAWICGMYLVYRRQIFDVFMLVRRFARSVHLVDRNVPGSSFDRPWRCRRIPSRWLGDDRTVKRRGHVDPPPVPGATRMNRAGLWQSLSEAGLVSGELPQAATNPQSPWPVRLMLGVAGWIGALFLLGFALVAFTILGNSAGAAIPAGAICCFAAYLIFRTLPRNEFIAQFGFALSIAGQSLIVIGLFNLNGSSRGAATATFLVMAAIEAALAVFVPNYVHRAFTALAANVFLFLASLLFGGPVLPALVAAAGVVVVWLHTAPDAKRASFWEPIGYGFAIALLHFDGAMLFGDDLLRLLWSRSVPLPPYLIWAAQAVTSALFFYVAWQLRERAGVKLNSPGGIVVTAGAIVVTLCGLGAPGISAAILVLVLGFANSNRVLMGLGLIAFGFYLSHFYYQLDTTLLVKSMILAATGVVILGLWWAIERYLPAPRQEPADA